MDLTLYRNIYIYIYLIHNRFLSGWTYELLLSNEIEEIFYKNFLIFSFVEKKTLFRVIIPSMHTLEASLVRYSKEIGFNLGSLLLREANMHGKESNHFSFKMTFFHYKYPLTIYLILDNWLLNDKR